MRNWHVVVLATLFAPGMRPASAEQAPRCEFEVTCALTDRKATLTFVSPSLREHGTDGDCLDDDDVVSLDGKKLDLPPAYYFDVRSVGHRKTPCRSTTYDQYPAFPLPGGRLLLVMRRNNRPHFDRLSAAVIDLATAAVIDHQDLGETMRASTGLREVKPGFWQTPVVREFLTDMQCDCDAAFVEGWIEISVRKNGHIVRRWAK